MNRVTTTTIEEADPAGVRRLADDLRRALGRQLDRAGLTAAREPLDRRRLGRRARDGQTLLGLASGRSVTVPRRASSSVIRCSRSACAAG